VLDHIGMSAARQWITRFGFELNRHPNNLTLALGTGSVTPLQMAAAYAVFANGGHRVTPVLIEKIVDAKGQVIFEAPPPVPLDGNTRVIPARNAFITNTLMRDVTARGTAARAQGALGRSDVYGKTGTTNDAVDAWFAGWGPGVAAVAWIGHDEPKSLGERETGGGLALPVWIDAVARSLRGVNFQPLYQPDDVVAIEGDWRYVEYEAGGFVVKVGEPEVPVAPEGAASGAVPATAASAPAAAASGR
jgi:penicillin-binding protein 1A